MTVKLYTTIMLVATLMSWGAWLLVLFLVSPRDAGTLGFTLFYVSLFLGIMGTLSMIGLLVRHIRVKHRFIVEKVIDSFRQAFWFAGLVITALGLQSHGQLTWWNALLLILIVASLEFFFISATRGREHRKYI